MLSKTHLPAEVEFQKKLHYISGQFREKPTQAEQFLWQFLRRKQLLGLRFLRQHPIDRYIVDFVCYKRKLVIEVDGDIHLLQKERDKNKDYVLECYGFYVLRVTNDEVLNTINIVLERIKLVLSPLAREESQRGEI